MLTGNNSNVPVKCKQFPQLPHNQWFSLINPQISQRPPHPEHPVNYLFPTGPPSPSPFAHGYLAPHPSRRLTHLTQPFRIPYFLSQQRSFASQLALAPHRFPTTPPYLDSPRPLFSRFFRPSLQSPSP